MAMDTLVNKFTKKMDLSKNASECVKFIGQDYYPFIRHKQGIVMEILNDAAKKYNFCYNLNVMLDNTMPYGEYIPGNKTYSGMLGFVHRKEYEAALDPIVFSQEYLSDLEVTTFLFIDPVSVVMPYPVFEPNIIGFLLPFSWQMWVAILFSFFIVALTYFLLTIYGRPLDSSEQISPSFLDKLFRGFYISLEILLGQDIYNRGIGDTRLKVRLLVCTWLLSGFIISQSFKCNLKSMLIKPKVNLAFNTFEGMISQKKVKYFTTHGTYLDQKIKNSPPDSLYGKIDKGRMKDRLKPGESINMLLTGDYAYIGSAKVNEGVLHLTYKNGQCLLTLMPEQLNTLRVQGLYFHKGSIYRDYFNHIITCFRESGIYQFMNELMLYNAQKCKKVKDSIMDQRALSLKDYYGIFILYLAGLILAFLVFLKEVLTFHLNPALQKKEKESQHGKGIN